jgi:hypothetical protein
MTCDNIVLKGALNLIYVEITRKQKDAELKKV